MNDYPLTTTFLEKILKEKVKENVFPQTIRDAQVILSIGRAYRSFGYNFLPKVIESKLMLIPFYVFKTEEYMTTIPAAGLPMRLFKNYQFTAIESSKGTLPADAFIVNPDVALSVALEKAGDVFTAHPISTHVSLIMVPFYNVRIVRGKGETEVLINAFNGDVLLEHPPPRWSDKKAKSQVFSAVLVFVTFVAVITGTWLLSASLLPGIIASCVVGIIARQMILWKGKKEESHD